MFSIFLNVNHIEGEVRGGNVVGLEKWVDIRTIHREITSSAGKFLQKNAPARIKCKNQIDDWFRI